MMMKMTKMILVASILALLSGTALEAQVVIGADLTPNPGALLELKSNGNSGTNANATAGFLFPRVNISNFTPATDAAFAASIGGTGSWNRQTHTGLVVYNVGSPAGLYLWNGTQWETFSAVTASPIVTAANGLNKNGTSIELGGALTKPTTTISGSAQSIVFDLQNVTASNEGLLIKNLPALIVNKSPLAVDVITGKVGILGGGSEAKIAFLQATNNSYLSSYATGGSADAANNSRTRTIPWNISNVPAGLPSTGGDMVTNNLVVFIPSENSFELLEDIAVELSGYIGYGANVTNIDPVNGSGSTNGGTSDITVVNASIQVKRAGGGTYENYSSVRAVYQQPTTPYRQTLNIPPAMLIGYRGDRIRMVVIPQPSDLGTSHRSPAVVNPFGSDFCKSLKIVGQ
jgi:hypothetical protein